MPVGRSDRAVGESATDGQAWVPRPGRPGSPCGSGSACTRARPIASPDANISDYLADDSVTVWLDLRGPNHLAVLSEEFGLHPLAVEAALHHSQRPKLDRYRSHLFLTAYGARLDPSTGELATSEIAAFLTGQALITVRKDDGLDIGAVIQHLDKR